MKSEFEPENLRSCGLMVNKLSSFKRTPIDELRCILGSYETNSLFTTWIGKNE